MTPQDRPLPTRESTLCAIAFTKMNPVMVVNEKMKGPRWALIRYLGKTPLRIVPSLVSAWKEVLACRAQPTPGSVGLFAVWSVGPTNPDSTHPDSLNHPA